MKTTIINAKDAIMGRMGTFAAKELLKGNSVKIINSEQVIISGKKEYFVDKIKRKRKMGRGGSLKGPKYILQSDKLLKRIIRGMLPWDKPKGKDAYKRLKCYIKEGDLSYEELQSAISFNNKKPTKYTTMKEVIGALK